MALDADAEVQIVLRPQGAELEAPEQRLVERAAERGAELIELPTAAMARVLDVSTPQRLAAVVTRPRFDLDDLLAAGPPEGPVVVLVGVSDPGNAGTLLRSAEAFGAAAVVCCEGSVDPFHPKTVRASAGSVLLVPLVTEVSPRPALAALGDAGVRRVGTVVRGGTDLRSAGLDGPLAIVLGSEAHGLPAGLEAALEELVTIPMSGRAESLNVAMAGTLVIFEAARRRQATATGEG